MPVEYVLYSYFCAGSGGVGDTILATSYMLCGEDVVCWDGGERVVTASHGMGLRSLGSERRALCTVQNQCRGCAAAS